jgi:aminoglycoside 6'-N-acetyltransferase I
VTVADLALEPETVREQAAALLVEAFPEPPGWPTMPEALEEIATVIADGFARVAIEGSLVLGWIGGLPEYNGCVWELHPLVVHREYRRRGIGRALCETFESEARARGAFTATLGTDDTTGMTSVANTDLHRGISGHIAGLRDLGQGHPFLFYAKLGYVVTGLMPDANGPGKPDIYMSKSLRKSG